MADGSPVELSPKSIADLRKLGDAYRGGDKALRKAIRDGLTEAGKPLALETVKVGASRMPRRGGLAARIAASRGAVSGSFTARGASVSIRLTNKQKDSLAGLDAGLLRHPVWRTGKWVAQPVPAGAFSEAFQAGAPIARVKMTAAVERALEQIAREAD